MSILLHCCCGPCLGGSFPILEEKAQKEPIAVFWDNPNIHPYIEYRERLLAFQKMARILELDIHYGDPSYGLDRFIHKLDNRIGPERCELCYDMRLMATAQKAKELGYKFISTTLLISPYQDHELIISRGNEIAQSQGVEFLYVDLRPGFKNTHESIREHDLYKQKYCGCIFSEHDRYKNAKKYKLPIENSKSG